jgi:threonine synthase
MKRLELKCRECSAWYPAERIFICEKCLAPLEVVYSEESTITKETLESRVKSMWRYFELLPVEDKTKIVDLGTGYTPLIRAERLSEKLGIDLFLKNDTVNPTLSFKDRPSSVAVTKAVEFGDNDVCCVSTGNLAASVAAHAAHAGLNAYVITPENIEKEKFAQIIAYGAKIITVEGTYDDANRLAAIASLRLGWNIVNITTRPYYVEGSKTIAYEICEQMNWNLPDYVVVPCASGALLRSIHRGFKQFKDKGLIESIPRLIGAQASGCSPLVNAFRKRSFEIEPVRYPKTIAKSIAIGDPADGKYAILSIMETDGCMEEASDEEIVDATKLLASKEGIFAEPAGSVTIAVTKKLIDLGFIEKGSSVVCCVTGNGMKAQELVLHNFSPLRVKPEIESFEKKINSRVN